MLFPNRQLKTIVSTYTVIILFGSSTCLKIVGVFVPALADLRQPASLGCSYDTGQDALFSVKWYKDDHEFYRYMPNQKPSIQTFPMTGGALEEVDGAECGSSQCSIRLGQLSPAASGAYTCEVSTEAPTFRTALETRNMTVMALPREKPRIEGLKSAYTIGEVLDIKCRSAPSAPAAIPSFFINDIEIEEKYVTRSVDPSPEGTWSGRARLRLVLARAHFVGTLLRVRCTAALPAAPAAQRATDATAMLVAPQPLRNQKLEWLNGGDHITLPSLSLVVLSCFSLILMFSLSWQNHLH